MTIDLYRHIPPAGGYPNSYYTNVGEEYRGFLIIREGDYMLYEIQAKEKGNTPIPLRSKFTNKEKAKECINNFLDDKKP
jgi:hypothetical protein